MHENGDSLYKNHKIISRNLNARLTNNFMEMVCLSFSCTNTAQLRHVSADVKGKDNFLIRWRKISSKSNRFAVAQVYVLCSVFIAIICIFDVHSGNFKFEINSVPSSWH